MHPFLTAVWSDLLLVSWKVPDELLLPYLPNGLELDRLDGSALVSLVAFDFRDTRVFGVRWPGFVNFPELNLRFYVRYNGQRGVCFLREYVPGRLVALLARRIYNEPYVAAPYRKEGRDHVLEVAARSHRIRWRTEGQPYTPDPSSTEHFIKEHELGFGRDRRDRTVMYRVEHPVWRVWPTVEHRLEIDTGALYGPQWQFLLHQPPCSVVAAEGSPISVYPAARLPVPGA